MEALYVWERSIISLQKGIEGISLNPKDPPFIIEDEKMFNKIIANIKNNKVIRKVYSLENYYLEKYSMRNIIRKFIDENKI